MELNGIDLIVPLGTQQHAQDDIQIALGRQFREKVIRNIFVHPPEEIQGRAGGPRQTAGSTSQYLVCTCRQRPRDRTKELREDHERVDETNGGDGGKTGAGGLKMSCATQIRTSATEDQHQLF